LSVCNSRIWRPFPSTPFCAGLLDAPPKPGDVQVFFSCQLFSRLTDLFFSCLLLRYKFPWSKSSASALFFPVSHGLSPPADLTVFTAHMLRSYDYPKPLYFSVCLCPLHGGPRNSWPPFSGLFGCPIFKLGEGHLALGPVLCHFRIFPPLIVVKCPYFRELRFRRLRS